jgi:nitrogen PTS system EIIA component
MGQLTNLMSALQSWLSMERTFVGTLGQSKKKVLQSLSEFLSGNHTNLNSESLYNGLIARERLGSTAMGEGIAIPHCRIEDCARPLISLIRLTQSIDFEAVDRKKVDLLIVLIVPKEATDEHLQLLADIARRLSDKKLVAKLRQSENSTALYQAFMDS